MSDIIYLDHAATTPVRPEVLAAMLPYFGERYGNPSSLHRLGRETAKALRMAREQMAGALGCSPGEIVITGSGTEADNLALRGVALARRQRGEGNHIVVSAVEHKGILDTACHLRDYFGFDLTVLPVDAAGRVDPTHLAVAIRPDTAIVSIMAANNEVGALQPLARLSAVCRERGVPLHSDAVQASGTLSLRVDDLGVDLLSLGAHKFYGPKGIGVLYVRDGVDLSTSQTGGGQEFGLRAGTQNVALIVGLAKALELAYADFEARCAHFARLRNRLIDGVLSYVPGAHLSGHPENRLCTHASFVFDHLPGGVLVGDLDRAGICASSASACKAGSSAPSGVLTALGYPADLASASLRLTVGLHTTDAEIDFAVTTLAELVQNLQTPAPQAELTHA